MPTDDWTLACSLSPVIESRVSRLASETGRVSERREEAVLVLSITADLEESRDSFTWSVWDRSCAQMVKKVAQ